MRSKKVLQIHRKKDKITFLWKTFRESSLQYNLRDEIGLRIFSNFLLLHVKPLQFWSEGGMK